MNKVIFADGTELTGFTVNGSLLIFETPVNTSTWTTAQLKRVVVKTADCNMEYNNAVVLPFDATGFAFGEKSGMELLQESIQSQLDYIAMMADVEL